MDTNVQLVLFRPKELHMFTLTAEYALRIVVYLGSLNGTPVTTKQLAAATQVPAGYLSKVLQALSRAGIVVSQRGLHGGSVLAMSANELTVYDVVQAVAPLQRIRVCPLGLKAHANQLCPLHQRMDNALAMVEMALRASTITDLLNDPSTNKPLTESSNGALARVLPGVPLKVLKL